MELILIRHGLPIRKELEDRPADPPLSNVGRQQAKRVADYLSAETIDCLYASPMLRAQETAAPFADLSGLTVELHPGIVEFDRDANSYIPMEELKVQDYETWQALGNRNFSSSKRNQAFADTVITALENIIAKHPGQRIAAFCHGGVINLWASQVLGIPPRLFFEPEYTSIHRFLCASTGERNIRSLNEVAHLRNWT